MKKIKITESQLKKILKNRNKMVENLDMPDDPNMGIKVNKAIFSHLNEIQSMGVNEKVLDRLKFIKELITKFPDTNQEITTRDLDMIYDSILGMENGDMGGDNMDNFNNDDSDSDDNPFPDGYDFSMNESMKKIYTEFTRYL